jgi:hypothetical protein
MGLDTDEAAIIIAGIQQDAWFGSDENVKATLTLATAILTGTSWIADAIRHAGDACRPYDHESAGQAIAEAITSLRKPT